MAERVKKVDPVAAISCPLTCPQMPRSDHPGKRERLVTAAYQLLYQQGVERTTLVEIAELATVPVGNVYYYFKTKNELIAPVRHVLSTVVSPSCAGHPPRLAGGALAWNPGERAPSSRSFAWHAVPRCGAAWYTMSHG